MQISGLEAVLPEVATDIVDGIGWIILNRPAVRNAARPQSMKQICTAIDGFSDDPDVQGIVLAGNGGHFMAGGDFEFLGELTQGSAGECYDTIYKHFQGANRRLYRCTKPTLAAVSGAAITVGCELALACDVRIADDTAFFEESWLRLGLLPPLGGAMLLPRIVGLAMAKAMILEARRVYAEEALRMGLVSAIVPAGELRDRAQARIKAMAAFPSAAFRAAKEAIHRGLESSMETEWQATVLAQGILLASDEFKGKVSELARDRDSKRA